MSDFPPVAGHHYEAEVTPSGYGSRIFVDGVEMPEVVSFRIEATVNDVTLDINVLALAKVRGVADRIRLSGGDVYVLTDAEGAPVRVCFSIDEMKPYLNEHIAWGFQKVPAEAVL